jgi:hypothetical protein
MASAAERRYHRLNPLRLAAIAETLDSRAPAATFAISVDDGRARDRGVPQTEPPAARTSVCPMTSPQGR